jgi:acyl-CoA reductase-like NAD-dependent aldehyde dehydrogenase
VDGAWRPAGGDTLTAVHDSGTEERIGSVRSSSISDVDAAVGAATSALPGWSTTSPHERADVLLALHDALAERSSELAGLISAEVGTAVRMSSSIQVASALSILSETARLVRAYEFVEQLGNVTVTQQPVGVTAAITPWNYPLFQSMAKVGAALAAGSTVVHKPSGLAPLSAFVLAEACASAGLPRGVYNLITGPGTEIGAALATHRGVSMVSFTGSTEAGVAVYRGAAQTMKRVALELGGKSASVVLEDADLPTAIRASVNRGLLNSGQTCDAWTRLLVPAARLVDCVELAREATAKLTLGDPFDLSTRLGPLVSGGQVVLVRGYIDEAVAAGATLVTGGSKPPADLDRGFYVQPTLLADVRPDMVVAREEVFGPVLAIMSYTTEEQAIEIANATDYGLSGAVWSADPDRAGRVADRIRAGQVVINGGRFSPIAPVGGVKMSGLGRELGAAGIAEYLESKSLVH